MVVTLFSNSLFRQPINVLFKIMMAPHYKICVLFYHFLFTSIINKHIKFLKISGGFKLRTPRWKSPAFATGLPAL